MNKTFNALKARQHFGELLNRVYYGKETVIVERRGKVMAIVIPMEEYKKLKENQKKGKKVLEQIKTALKTAYDDLNTSGVL